MMTTIDQQTMLETLGKKWPKARWDKDDLARFANALKRYPVDVVTFAMAYWKTSQKHAPKVYELVNVCAKRTQKPVADVGYRWVDALRAQRRRLKLDSSINDIQISLLYCHGWFNNQHRPDETGKMLPPPDYTIKQLIRETTHLLVDECKMSEDEAADCITDCLSDPQTFQDRYFHYQQQSPNVTEQSGDSKEEFPTLPLF